VTTTAAPTLLFPTHYLGNLVLGLPWVLQVLQSHPRALVVLDSRFLPLARLVLHESVDILPYSRQELSSKQPFLGRLSSYRRFLMALRRRRRSPLLDLEGERFTGVISLLSGSRQRVGPAGKRAERFYTRVLELDYHRHRFNAFGEICAGFTNGAMPPAQLHFRLPGCVDQQLLAVLPELAATGPFVAIHPGASVAYKLWPPDYFADLVRGLENAGCRVIWVGAGAMDRDVIDSIRQRLQPDHTLSACDRLTLPELVALYKSCDFFIGSDSGPMHLAAATGMPVFALFGPSKDSIWAPLGTNSRLLRGSERCAEDCDAHHCRYRYRCLSSLQPQQVLAAVCSDRKLAAEESRI